ncbi:hypothetical protein BDW69DRAFT_178207 [Aspergillus filifer]
MKLSILFSILPLATALATPKSPLPGLEGLQKRQVSCSIIPCTSVPTLCTIAGCGTCGTVSGIHPT